MGGVSLGGRLLMRRSVCLKRDHLEFLVIQPFIVICEL